MSTSPARPAAKPAVAALLLADGIHRDGLGKHYVLGIFNSIQSPQYPITLPLLAVYLALTDGHGRTGLEVRVVPADDDPRPLFANPLVLEFPSPLVVLEVAMHVPRVTVPAAGEYRLQVACGGEVLAERRLLAVQTGAARGAAGDGPAGGAGR